MREGGAGREEGGSGSSRSSGSGSCLLAWSCRVWSVHAVHLGCQRWLPAAGLGCNVAAGQSAAAVLAAACTAAQWRLTAPNMASRFAACGTP